MPATTRWASSYLALYEVEVDDWADFAGRDDEGFADGRITVDPELLSMDPMVKTMVFEQLGDAASIAAEPGRAPR